MRFELQLGIIEGDVKRRLEDYIDTRLFKQRKNFDEYTLCATSTEFNADIGDLMILAEIVTVRVLDDCVMLSDL
jgi:hypothetical protein